MAKGHNKLITAVVGVFVAVAMIGPTQTFIDDANLTGSTALIVGLIPFFIGLGAMLLAVGVI